MKLCEEADVTPRQCSSIIHIERKNNIGKKCYGIIKHFQEKATWVELNEKYDLKENSWIQNMYNLWGNWAKSFIKDTFFVGMTTSGRSESIHSFFDGDWKYKMRLPKHDGMTVGWRVDSHMCPNRDWFATYRSFDGGKVLMRNDVTCKGSTVAGATTSSDIDSHTTKLWHMLLGHMSDKGMDVLSKQGLLGSKKIGKLDFCEHYVFGKQCRKEELIDVGKDHSVREKVELEVRAPDSLPIIPRNEEDDFHSIEENEEPQEKQYSIARNRSRREIQLSQKYRYADIVTYSLSMAESIELSNSDNNIDVTFETDQGSKKQQWNKEKSPTPVLTLQSTE
ncbi:hypothetical protein RJ639_042667 [Escallonia herrerae]|uniref:Protein FAR1-RELATED SEQUENCE n=1 Tax=Escallonia herrerae TaxID=1293975 RepID=A0AA88WD76_9ASTE|nr:hypothetical protein RJ639_042667 [Escallonia herrerae]